MARPASSQSGVLACALVTVSIVSATRTVLPFNDGWRFHQGDGDLPYECSTNQTASDFPVDLTGVWISGLNQVAASDAAGCQAACAAICTCQAWQFSATLGCWTGVLQACGPSNWGTNGTGDGWVGGGRFGPAVPANQTSGPASPTFNDSATFIDVTLPHDYIAHGVPVYNASDDQWQQNHGYIPFANGWYRKTFSLPSEWQDSLIRIHFDGVYRSSDYFLDGYWIGHHESGYTQFDLWLHNTSAGPLSFGPSSSHVLAVHIDGTTFAEGWYYEGSGITRDVSIVAVDSAVSINPFGVFVPSTVTGPVSAPEGAYGPQTASALVMPQIDVSNDGTSAANYIVTSVIVDPSGNVVGSAASSSASLPAGGWARVQQSIALDTALLWFPAQNATSPDRPLYTLSTTVSVSGVAVDAINTTFGIRSAIFDANSGLIVNGFPVKITGFSMHNDFGGCGMAVPPNMIAYRVQRLLELGGNGWRTAHNPPSPLLLAETDKRGVLVWEENRFLRHTANFINDAQDMVLQDRNHPSIIMWSLCNENGCLESPGMEGAYAPYVAGAAVALAYKDAMFAADGTRPITANTHALISEPGTILDSLDVLGVTYDYSAYDTLHQARPWAPVIGGESASCESDRGFSINGGDGIISSYSPLGCTGPAWQAAADRAWIPGSFQWAGADYAGESSWPAVSSHYGVIDLCGFPKPAAHWYQAWWGGARTGTGGQPVGDPSALFAYPAWDGAGYDVGQQVSIVAFSTAPLLSLSVNDVVTGSNISMTPFGYAQWNDVTYQPGSYTVTSYTNATSPDGSWTVAATYTSATPGPATNLTLSIAWPGTGPAGSLLTDGIDAAIITVSAVDASGALSSASAANVTFSISGPASVYGVCNGNPVDHSPQKASQRALYAGLARLIVQSMSTNSSEPVMLTATSPGLQPATLMVPTSAPARMQLQ